MTLPSPKLKETRNISILENQNRGYDRINDSALVITQSPAYNYDSMIVDTLKHAPSRY